MDGSATFDDRGVEHDDELRRHLEAQRGSPAPPRPRLARVLRAWATVGPRIGVVGAVVTVMVVHLWAVVLAVQERSAGRPSRSRRTPRPRASRTAGVLPPGGGAPVVLASVAPGGCARPAPGATGRPPGGRRGGLAISPARATRPGDQARGHQPVTSCRLHRSPGRRRCPPDAPPPVGPGHGPRPHHSHPPGAGPRLAPSYPRPRRRCNHGGVRSRTTGPLTSDDHGAGRRTPAWTVLA